MPHGKAPKNSSRLKAIKSHFSRRMAERFGIAINQHIIAQIVAQIQGGLSPLIFRESGSKSCFRILWQDREIAVIYSHKYKTPVTAMPLEWAKQKAAIIKTERAAR